MSSTGGWTRQRLLNRRSRQDRDRRSGLQPLKLRAIDYTFRRFESRSVADLGGVWAVEAGYTFHALERGDLDRAILVDTGITDAVVERARDHAELELVHANFASATTAEQVGDVDTVLLFDVLLHQVDPDWDAVIQMYAPHTRSFVVVQPQWFGGNETVRLIDLGRDEFLASVPDEPLSRELFDRLDEFNPKYGRVWRDVHEVWQWGITDADLLAVMEGAGFRLLYFEDDGLWQGLERFASRAFVFGR